MYATIEQANAYVTSYYSSTDNIRIKWEALSGADKQVALNKAEQIIDSIPFKGRPVEPHQHKAFPRHPDKELSLEKAKDATIELALQRNGDSEAIERLKLQKQGVKSYKLGDLSETFKDGNNLDYDQAFAVQVIFPFLKDWLSGGYEICPTHTRRFRGRW